MSALRLFAGLAVVGLAACSDTASQPDSRLGTLVYESSLRPASRATTQVSTWLTRALVLPTTDGATHVVLVAEPGRRFGSSEVTSSGEVVYRVVGADGKMTSKPAPELGIDTPHGRASFVAAADGSPAIVLQAPAEERYDYATVHVFDGHGWRRHDFTRKDRASTDLANTWGFTSQVRVLSPSELVVQHGGALARLDGDGWHELPTPPGAKEVALGMADATRVRVYWVTASGDVATDVLDRATWSYAGAVSTWPQGAAAFGRGWNHSGTVDLFTLSFPAAMPGGGTSIVVLRFVEGRFVRAETRAAIGSELTGDSWLETLSHPYRGVFNDQGTLIATYLGKATGPLGHVPAKVEVTCETTCTRSPEKPVGTEDACHRCTPRALELAAWRETPDADGVAALLLDGQLDLTMRVYLKRLPLPFDASAVTVPFSPGTFPGDTGQHDEASSADGGVVATTLTLRGRVLVPGASDHTGTTVRFAVGSTELARATTSADGSFALGPFAPTAATLSLARPGYTTLSVSFADTDVGVVDVSRTLVSDQVKPATLPDAGVTLVVEAGLLNLNGSTLSYVARSPTPVTQVLTTRVSAGTAPVVLDPEQGLFAWTEGACPGCAWHAFPLPSQQLTGATGRASLRVMGGRVVWAEGTPDGVTPLAWRMLDGSTPSLLSADALDVLGAPHAGSPSLYAWRRVAPGDVRVVRLDPNSTHAEVPGSRSLTPVPVLVEAELRLSRIAGFGGSGCGAGGGWTTGCGLWLIPAQVEPLAPKQVSTSAVAFVLQGRSTGLTTPRLVWLERSGSTATVKKTDDDGATVQTLGTFTLPGTFAPDQPPLVPVQWSTTTLLRGADGLYATSDATPAPHLVLPRLVRVERLPDAWNALAVERVVAWQAPASQSDCTQGCQLSTAQGDGPLQSLGFAGNEGEVLTSGGLYSDASSWTGLTGPTHVVTFVPWSGTPTVLAAGRLVPDRTQLPFPGLWHFRGGPAYVRLDGSAEQGSLF